MSGISTHEWSVLNDVIGNANLVIEVLDARDPIGTRNAHLEKLVMKYPDKRLLVILNKIDLIPQEIATQWTFLLKHEFPTFAISCTKGFERTIRLLRKKILEIAPMTPAYVAIVGYTNVGKSTIINGLKGSKVVRVSPQAGFTRGKQYITLSEDILLIDSPGIIPIEGNEIEMALRDMLSPEKINNIEAVVEEIIKRTGHATLEELYKVKFTDSDDFLEKLSRLHGKLLSGGVPDTYESAKFLVREWQRDRINHYQLPPTEKNNIEYEKPED
jgi:ribosome biogenesis GTPase A